MHEPPPQEQLQRALEVAREALARQQTAAALDALDEARRLPGYEQAPELVPLLGAATRSARRGRLRGAWPLHTLEGLRLRSSQLTQSGLVIADREHHLHVLDLETARHVRTVQHQERLEGLDSLSVTPDGRIALCGGNEGSAWVLDLNTGQRINRFLVSPSRPKSRVSVQVSLSSDGRLALCRGRGLFLCDIASGQKLHALRGAGGAFSENNQLIFTWDDRELRAWDPSTGALLHQAPYGHKPQSFTPKGRFALSLSWNPPTAHLTDLSHEAGWSFPLERALWSWRMSSDERVIVAGGEEGTLSVFEVETGLCRHKMTGHAGKIEGLAIDPFGAIAASFSEDRTLRLWDLATGECLCVLPGSQRRRTELRITKDARFLLVGNDDALEVWYLDWELFPSAPSDWDEGARPVLSYFLSSRAPWKRAGLLPWSTKRLRRGRPRFTEAALAELLEDLRQRGYGWLRPEGVRRQLRAMIRSEY